MKTSATDLGLPHGPIYPQLRARRNVSGGEVARHQKARLRSAMIEACARKGYEATTGRDVIRLAGVSTKTFYKHFGGKQGCFLDTFDLVVRRAMAGVADAYRDEPGGDRDWDAAVRRAFDAYVAAVVERPGEARLALVDSLATGPGALPRLEECGRRWSWMLARCLEQAPEPIALPAPLLRAVVGGVWFVSRTRILGRDPAVAQAASRVLVEWLLALRAPEAERLPRVVETLRPAAPARRPPGGAEPRARMLRAAAEIAAAEGVARLGERAVAEAAGVSSGDFEREFAGPLECFQRALELLTAEALGRARREALEADDWSAGVCRAILALLRQAASDRVFSRCLFRETVALGGAGAECRGSLIGALAEAFASSTPRPDRIQPLLAEAIAASVWALVSRHAIGGRADLTVGAASRAAYLALSPVVGAAGARDAIERELAPRPGTGARRTAPAPAPSGFSM